MNEVDRQTYEEVLTLNYERKLKEILVSKNFEERKEAIKTSVAILMLINDRMEADLL